MLASSISFRLKEMEGTPGYPNQRLSLADAPEEQVAYEHFNARRADASDALRQIDGPHRTLGGDRFLRDINLALNFLFTQSPSRVHMGIGPYD
jgi:hypothetical protein